MRTPGTTVETEPRGAKCGRDDDNLKGPDVLLAHTGHTHFLDFKSINVVAPTNRESADKDLRLVRRPDDDDAWIDDAGSHLNSDVSQSSATGSILGCVSTTCIFNLLNQIAAARFYLTCSSMNKTGNAVAGCT